ncbi:MAG: hypothetical protein JRN67_08085, partial [Nitrososphaerota archaeon]|nr:hypothetical protein [Nitrososphaerota archaeon]
GDLSPSRIGDCSGDGPGDLSPSRIGDCSGDGPGDLKHERRVNDVSLTFTALAQSSITELNEQKHVS